MNIISIIKSIAIVSLLTLSCAVETWERDIRPIGFSEQQLKMLNSSLKKWNSGDHISEYSRNTIQFVSRKFLIETCGSYNCVAHTQVIYRWNDEIPTDECRRINIFIDEKYKSGNDVDLEKFILHELGHMIMFNSCDDLYRGYNGSGHIITVGHSLYPSIDGMTNYVTPEDRELVCLNNEVKDIERKENWR